MFIAQRPARRTTHFVALFLAALLSAGCSFGPQSGDNLPDPGESDCLIPSDQIRNGGPGKDGIPALTDPKLISVTEAHYVRNDDRVVAFKLGGEWIVIPHNIFWWHEIVNLNRAGEKVAVTYCPLTGSALAFDRDAVDGAEFGVSGLLYQSNLIMYDRRDPASLWTQLDGRASCGSAAGARLTQIPVIEAAWGGWKSAFPESRVVSSDTGHDRTYTFFPYGSYESLSDPSLLFPVSNLDERRPVKERVLGIPVRGSQQGLAIPLSELAKKDVAALHVVVGGDPFVVFWTQRLAAATVFNLAENPTQTVEVSGGKIVDSATRTEWSLDGHASGGPLAGTRLSAHEDAMIVFWFAWAAFYPDTEIWIN